MNAESQVEPVKHTGYATLEEVAKLLESSTGSCCWNCRYFGGAFGQAYEGSAMGVKIVRTRLSANCLRHSPVAGKDERGEATAVWPVVEHWDWCGDYANSPRTAENFTAENVAN